MWTQTTSNFPRFGSSYGLDLGASDQTHGNLRVRTFDDNGETVGDVSTGIVKEEGFIKSDDLVEGIAERIKQAQEKNKSILGKDDAITSVTIFTPGQANLHNVIIYYENLKDRLGESLRLVDFGQLKQLLEQKGVKVAPNFDLKVANDMVGGTAETLRQMRERYPALFKPGLSILYLATGGGLGVSYAEINRNGDIQIRSSETSNVLDLARGGSFEDTGAAGRALVYKFLSKLNLSPATMERLKSTARAIIVDNYTIAKEVVPGLTKKQFEQASNYAINEYIDSIARIAAFKVMEGVNRTVISGPTAKGLKNYLERYVRENPKAFATDLNNYSELRKHGRKAFGKEDIPWSAERPAFEKIFLGRVWHHLNEGGKMLFTWNQFDMITDIHVADNTAGARLLQKAKVDGRGDRFILPGNAFNN